MGMKGGLTNGSVEAISQELLAQKRERGYRFTKKIQVSDKVFYRGFGHRVAELRQETAE